MHLYRNLAKYYDHIYSYKNYMQEASIVRSLIMKWKKSSGVRLLDAGCGTGRHLMYLKNSFSCTGIDSSAEVLKIARKNVRGVAFKQADMMNFCFGRFDCIISLFSSIGYVKTYANLKKTIQNFSRHLNPGGVLIIEPWLMKNQFKPSMPHMVVYDGKDIKIARLNVPKARGNVSVLDMHFLIVEKGKGVQHVSDRHELLLFDVGKTLKIMKDAEIDARYEKGFDERGLFIGVKT